MVAAVACICCVFGGAADAGFAVGHRLVHSQAERPPDLRLPPLLLQVLREHAAAKEGNGAACAME